MAEPEVPQAAAAAFKFGNFKFELPAVMVSIMAAALMTRLLGPAPLPASDELRGQIREIAADVKDLKRETKESLGAEQAYTSRNIPLIVQVLEAGCSAQFLWADGWRPSRSPWYPPEPGGPRWQPALALLPPPERR